MLGEHPNAGIASEEIAAGVKRFPARKYLIYYRKTRRGIDILQIFHGARDQAQAFEKPAKS